MSTCCPRVVLYRCTDVQTPRHTPRGGQPWCSFKDYVQSLISKVDNWLPFIKYNFVFFLGLLVWLLYLCSFVYYFMSLNAYVRVYIFISVSVYNHIFTVPRLRQIYRLVPFMDFEPIIDVPLFTFIPVSFLHSATCISYFTFSRGTRRY